MERKNSERASEPRGRSPEETPEQQRKREDKLLESASVVTALRNQLSLAFWTPISRACAGQDTLGLSARGDAVASCGFCSGTGTAATFIILSSLTSTAR